MQGRLTEVYKDRLVNVDTYLAEITKTVAEDRRQGSRHQGLCPR